MEKSKRRVEFVERPNFELRVQLIDRSRRVDVHAIITIGCTVDQR
jgi:hypothetical protein